VGFTQNAVNVNMGAASRRPYQCPAEQKPPPKLLPQIQLVLVVTTSPVTAATTTAKAAFT
jgi:hypothetical protein